MTSTIRKLAVTAALGVLLLAMVLGCEDDELGQGPGVLDAYVYLRGASEHSGTEVRLSGWRTGWRDTCGCVFSDSSGYYRFDGVSDGTRMLHFGHPRYF